MQAVYKTLCVALFAAFVAQASAQGSCSGDADASMLPYSTKWTSTGDAASTTFIMTVCNTQCTAPDSEYCQPLKSLAVGASDVTTYPDSSATDCGPTFTGDALASLGTESPSDPEHCEAFYITVDTPGAKIADVCGSESCQVQMELANGVKAVAGAAPVPPTPNPKPVVSPSPTPYGRRRNLQQATVTAYGRRM